ncbi:four helix bundle protein [Flavobacterium zhairuonense]|uniref:four helix bundle protein n=1 Tax=Flavobacterium zhairuonense TaxID=2493631 RepID=UPI002939450F|nr:four helix bundle protein [Flavobacterium zhairuonense]
MYVFSFEKLEVWQNARMFILDIYKLTTKFPSNELFGITSQIKEANHQLQQILQKELQEARIRIKRIF